MQIKKLREEAGISQTQLAEKSGVSQSAISIYERGAMRHPCAYTIAKIADALGHPVEKVLFGDQQEEGARTHA